MDVVNANERPDYRSTPKWKWKWSRRMHHARSTYCCSTTICLLICNMCVCVCAAVSVKTDFPPAEPPANYSANYPAKPPVVKNCRYPALAKHSVRARGLANCQIFGQFLAIVKQFQQNFFPFWPNNFAFWTNLWPFCQSSGICQSFGQISGIFGHLPKLRIRPNVRHFGCPEVRLRPEGKI